MRAGYTGGDVPHATYRNHSVHSEAIEIMFDPSQVTHRELLELFLGSQLRRVVHEAASPGQGVVMSILSHRSRTLKPRCASRWKTVPSPPITLCRSTRFMAACGGGLEASVVATSLR
jgi:hypothetical protein